MPINLTVRSVADSVRAAMRQSGLSQQALADALSLSQQAISRRLSGTVEFSISELTETATLLNVPLPDLLPVPSAQALAATRSSEGGDAA